MAFSSLLVLGAVDTLVVWFIGPFQKMDSWAEWSVVPLIVLFSLYVGFLNAVFLGIGISTFVFVAAFFRVGVVKYAASGLEIRSVIERSLVQSMWLDIHGDAIQVLVVGLLILRSMTMVPVTIFYFIPYFVFPLVLGCLLSLVFVYPKLQNYLFFGNASNILSYIVSVT
jgi:hypothetical protein